MGTARKAPRRAHAGERGRPSDRVRGWLFEAEARGVSRLLRRSGTSIRALVVMELRDKKILWHIGLHGVSIREVVEHLFFDGKSSGNVMQRLRNDGLIEDAARLPGNFTCYSLTRKGEAALGLTASPRK